MFKIVFFQLSISHVQVASVSKDQTCKLFSLVSGQLLLSVSFPVSLSAVTIGSACDSVYVGGDNGDVMSFSLGAPPRTVAVSSESQVVIGIVKIAYGPSCP